MPVVAGISPLLVILAPAAFVGPCSEYRTRSKRPSVLPGNPNILLKVPT